VPAADLIRLARPARAVRRWLAIGVVDAAAERLDRAEAIERTRLAHAVVGVGIARVGRAHAVVALVRRRRLTHAAARAARALGRERAAVTVVRTADAAPYATHRAARTIRVRFAHLRGRGRARVAEAVQRRLARRRALHAGRERS